MQDVQQASVRDHNDTSSSTTASTPVSSSQLLDMSTSGGPSTSGDGMEGDEAINKDTYSSLLREQGKEAGRDSQLLSSLPMDLLQESSLLQLFPPGGGHLREQAAGFMGGTVMTHTGLEPRNLGDVAGPSNGVREGTATYNELTNFGLHGALMRDELYNGGLWPHADSTVDAALHALYDMHDEYDGRASAPAALCIRRSHRRTISADSGMKSSSALLKHRLHSGRDSSAKRLKALHSLSVVSEEPGVAEGPPSPCSPHMMQRANSLPIMDPAAAPDGDYNPDATAVEVTSRVTPEICQQEEATTKPQLDAAQLAQHAQEQHEVVKSDSAQRRIDQCVAQTTAPQPKAAKSAARHPNGDGDSGRGSAVRKTLAARNVVTEADTLEEGMDETNPIPAFPDGLPTRAASHQRLTSAATSFPFPSAPVSFPTPTPLFSVTLPQTSSLPPNKLLYSSQNQTVYYPSTGTPASLPHSPLSHTPLDVPTSHNIRVILHVPKGVSSGPPPSTYTTALTYPYTNHLTSCVTPPTPAAPEPRHTSLSLHQHTAASFQLPPTTFPHPTSCHLTPPPLPAHHTQSFLRHSQAPQAATMQQTFLNPTTHASPSPRHGTNYDMVQRTAFQLQPAVSITPTSTAAPSTAFTPPSRPYTASGMVGADGSTSHILSTKDAVVTAHSRFDLPLHTLSSQQYGHAVTSLPTHLSNHTTSYGMPYTPSLPPPVSHSLQSAPSIGRVTSLDINSLQSNATRLLPTARSNSSYPLSLTATPSIPSPMSIIAMDDMNHDAGPTVLLSASSPLPSPMSGLSLPNVSSDAAPHQQHPPSIMPLSTLSLSRPLPAHPSTLPLTHSILLGSRSSMHELGGATEHVDALGFPHYGAGVPNSTSPGSVPAAGGNRNGFPDTQLASSHVSPFAAPSIQSQGGPQPSSMPKPWSMLPGAVNAATTSIMPKPWSMPPAAVNAATTSSMLKPWSMPPGAVNAATTSSMRKPWSMPPEAVNAAITSSDGVGSLFASRPFSGMATDSASRMRQHSAHLHQSPADQGHVQSMTHHPDSSWCLPASMASLTSSPYTTLPHAAQAFPTSLVPSENAALTHGVHSRQPSQRFSTVREAQGLSTLGEAHGLSTLSALEVAQGFSTLREAQTGTQVHESHAYRTITDLASPTTYFPHSNHLAAANKYVSAPALTTGALSHSPSLAARMTAAAEAGRAAAAAAGPLESVHAPPPAATAALSHSPSLAARMTAAGQPSSAHAPPPAAPTAAFPFSSHPAAGGQHTTHPLSRFNEQSHAAWIRTSSPFTIPSSTATALPAGAASPRANTMCIPRVDTPADSLASPYSLPLTDPLQAAALICPYPLPLAKPRQAPQNAINFPTLITPSHPPTSLWAPPALPPTSLSQLPTNPSPRAMWSTQLLLSDDSQTMSLDDTCILPVPSSGTPQAQDLAGKSPPHSLLLGSNMPLASSQLGGQHTLLGRQVGLHPRQSHANPPDPPHVSPHGSNGQPWHGPSSPALHSEQLQWHRPTHTVPSQSHGPTHVVPSQSHGATHAVPTHDSSACAAPGSSAQATSSLGDFVSDIVLLHEVCAVLGAEDQALVWQQPVEVGRQLVQDLRGKVPTAQWKAYVVEAVKLLRAQANMAKLTNNTGMSE